MTTRKQLAKRLLIRTIGASRAHEAANLYVNAGRWLRYNLSESGRRSARQLAAMHNRYLGERCVILGNGPSLNDTDLAPLRREFTFGSNRIYLLFPRLGFTTTFFVAVNRFVIEQCAKEIEELECLKFINWHARQFLHRRDDAIILLRSRRGRSFSVDPIRNGIWEGATVTYVSLQLAYYLGFQEVYLVGVDHSYRSQGLPHQLVTSAGDDANHFDASYFGRGFRWQLPDLATSEVAYRLAKRSFEVAGRRVLDATVGGNLKVFPKVSYDEVFNP